MIYAEKKRHFKNREQAGKELGILLETKYRDIDPLIFGIPRGGVEVAYYVASKFHCALHIIVSKKLPLPQQPEFGIGAVSEESTIYVSPRAEKLLYPDILDDIIEEQLLEVQRRVKNYRHGEPLPVMAGRNVIVVDDGIATGVTLVPVIKLCRKKHAANIIIAAPVSGLTFNEGLYEADAIEVLIQPPSFYAVGQVYENFGDFDDVQLMKLLSKADSD
ncbi:phosphoribosyltransferase [Flavihumibacter sp. R14]|nr:phosphoribosyltransferase [Flavihumibacter soli]